MFSNLMGLSLGVLGWISYAIFCVWGFLKIARSRREPLAETLEILDLLSSRRDPLLAPRTAWQKVGDFCICSVRAATPCWRRELLDRKLGILDSLSSRRDLLLAPRTLFCRISPKL